MRTKAFHLALLLIVSCYCSACSGAAGFWQSYRPDLISDSRSDQGPFGGTRWIQWTSTTPEVFGETAVIAFATRKGWVCSKPKTVSSDEVSGWLYMHEPVFPLVFGKSDPHTKDMKRHITGSAVVIACDSGWIRVDPGTAASSTAYGYILLNNDRSKMAVYHYWGE